jgi:hypothetical protein
LEVASIANGESRLATIFIVATQLLKTAMLVCAAITFGSIRALLAATCDLGSAPTDYARLLSAFAIRIVLA